MYLDVLQVITATRSPAATELLMHIVKVCILRDQAVTYQDLFSSMEVLATMAKRQTPASEPVLQLLEQARKASAAIMVANRPVNDVPVTVRDKNDPPNLREQTLSLFEDWLRLLTTSGGDDKALQQWMVNLRNAGLLKMDETTDRFFRTAIELSVNHCLQLEAQQVSP